VTPTTDVRSYLREPSMPHVLCSGCAHGIVLRAFLEAVVELGLDRDRLAMVAGIGCSSRLVGHVDACTLHATHGRAPGFATGLKLARPDLTVALITGDGDGLAIGGNHLVHAARRNLDLTVLLFNNAIYGMTGGQVAPTTREGALASTAPLGNVEPPFDACNLLTAAGATFVARALAFEPPVLTRLLSEALTHRGFSFIEVISDCPVFYGRFNHEGDGWEMLAGMKRHDADMAGILATKRYVPHLPATPTPDALPLGVLHREERPEYGDAYRAAAALARRPAANGQRGGPEKTARGTAPSPPAPAGAHGRQDVRVAGAGGQGVVMAGTLLAQAAVLDGRNATHSQVYGPESRGGASRSDIVIATGEIGFPLAEALDLLVALSPEAAMRFAPHLRETGLLVVDADGVPDPPSGPFQTRSLPIVATARRVTGGLIGTGVVTLGVLAELTGVVGAGVLEAVVAAKFPTQRETNVRGLNAGMLLAQEG
jgi:2-oxoglutarate/2-oxoacid ferredoxin oxidoreductase subunit beta